MFYYLSVRTKISAQKTSPMIVQASHNQAV